MKCPCKEAPCYCSKACQKAHWGIHKLTCELRKPKSKPKQAAVVAAAAAGAAAGSGLSEEEKDYIRIMAFMEESGKHGNKGVIEDVANFLGEHPLVTGGGNLTFGADTPGNQVFKKGDPQQSYQETKGVKWDGDPRFGMGPYVPKYGAKRNWHEIVKNMKQEKEKEASMFAAVFGELGHWK